MLKPLLLVLAGLPALCGNVSAQVFAEQGSPSQIPSFLSPHRGGHRFVAHGDFDNDGRLDLLAADSLESVVRIARGRGDGLFASWTDLSWPAAPQPTDVGVADFDGNGGLDLMYGASQGGGVFELWLALGDGAGGFPASRRVATGLAASFVRPRVADVDGDGDADAMIVAGGQVVLMRNDGTATFTPQAQPGSLVGTVDGTLIADVDGDGDPDFLAGPNLYDNDGTGSFTAAAGWRFPPGFCTNPTAAGDFNGDGIVDVAGGFAPAIWLQQPNGAFSRVTLPSAAPTVWGYAALDVDGDGDLDLVAGNVGIGPRTLLNDGAANFVLRTLLPEAEDVDVLETVDVDGDGDMDVIADHEHGAPRLLLSVGQPDLADAAVPTLGQYYFGRAAAAGDVDGDGDLDVVLSDAGDAKLFRNDGASRLRLDPGAIPRGGYWRDVHLGDLDGDGDLDLVVGIAVYENTGQGTFAFRVALGFSSEATVLHDLDGDGDLDILAERVLRNDGGFLFRYQGAAWFTNDIQDLELADYNGDGIDDMFVAVYQQQDRLFLGTGGGAFTEVPFIKGISATLSATAVDYDHDGDVDLLCGYQWGGTRVYENDGSGAFIDRTSAVFGGGAPFGAYPVVADFDLDGDRDILVTGDTMLFYEQTPAGFVDSSAAWTDLRYGSAILSADLDEDADEELILRSTALVPTVAAVAKVLTNRRTQLHAPQLGGTGRSVAIDAYGAGENVTPVLSPRRLVPKLATPWGRWGLDPVGAIALPSKTAGVAGSPATWSLSIPTSAALVGFEFYAQALFVSGSTLSDWRLSNVVSVPIVE